MSEQLHKLAHRLADEGGEILKKWFRNVDGARISVKDDATPVCQADLEAEELLRGLINEHCPDHGICGEELGSENENAEWVWVLDPLDGTSAFLEGIPIFGMLIALFHQGQPVYGVIDHPILRERWWGDGSRAFHNGAACKTAATASLGSAVLYASSPHMFKDKEKAASFAELREKCLKASYGLHCYSYGLLADGNRCLVAEADMKLFDYAPMAPIITAAGGVISDWQGRPLTLKGGDTVLAAANPKLHAEALKCL